MIKIHGEIICQSWPLLTPIYSGPIVQCIEQNRWIKSKGGHPVWTVHSLHSARPLAPWFYMP